MCRTGLVDGSGRGEEDDLPGGVCRVHHLDPAFDDGAGREVVDAVDPGAWVVLGRGRRIQQTQADASGGLLLGGCR